MVPYQAKKVKGGNGDKENKRKGQRQKSLNDVADVVSGVVWSHLNNNNNTLEIDKLVGLDDQGTKQVKAIKVYSSRFYDIVKSRSIKSECFMNLSELRYVDATYMRLIGDFTHLFPNLKWIKGSYLTARFNMKEIVIVDVYGLGDEGIQIKDAKKLKFLKVSDCGEMTKFPDFPMTLEMLHFSNKEEDMKLVNLQNLKVLILRSCTLGRIIGGTVGMMKGLRELNLIHINCDFHNFRIMIADIGLLSSLESFKFNSPKLKDVFKGIKLPKSLTVNNERTTELVVLAALKLKSMKLYSMTRIIMVEGQNAMLPSSLAIVHINYLQSDRILNLKNLSNLTELKFRCSPYLQEIQGIGGLKSLQIVNIVDIEKLAHIEGLGNLMSSSNCKLREVVIVGCPVLRALQRFEQHDDDAYTNDAILIEFLLILRIKGCPLMDWRSIPKLSKFPRLRGLSIEDIGDESRSQQQHDQVLEGLENLGELVELQVSRLAKLERLPCLSKLRNCRSFHVCE
ncbi:Disease resistance protein L6 [Linum grandiflorum]